MSVMAPYHSGPARESDTQLPDEEYIDMLKERNSYQYNYGDFKRQCEVSVQSQANAFPYTILRLPDVLGPYDNQGAWADVLLRHRNGMSIPARVEEDQMRHRAKASKTFRKANKKHDYASYKFSVAYAPDVIDAIFAVMNSDKKAVLGEIFNIANKETITVKDLLFEIGRDLDIPLELDMTTRSPLPTTDFGALDVSKALEVSLLLAVSSVFVYL